MKLIQLKKILFTLFLLVSLFVISGQEASANEIPTSEALPAEISTSEIPKNEVPTEEVRTEEVPTEEVPTGKVPTEEVPTGEVPTEEVPTEEVPTGEVPTTEEVPTGEVPTEEVPTEEVPTGEVPTTEEVPTGEVPIEKIPIEGPTKQVTPAAASNYPGTSTPMRPGDILYSSKSLFAHTLIVGHVAIVGPDYKVYHVSPAGEFAGKQDTLGTYRSRHGSKETIYVYRPKDADKGLSAADWASRNYSQVSTYEINAKPLYTLSPNYCSKFIWQAFYYSNGGDLTGLNRNGDSKVFITPGHVKNSNFFSYLTSFKGLD